MKNNLVVGILVSLPSFAYADPINVKSYGFDSKAQIDVIHDIDASTIDPSDGAWREFIVAQIPMSKAARKASNKTAISPNQSSFSSWLKLNTPAGESESLVMLNLMGSNTEPRLQIYKAFSTLSGFKFGLDFTQFANQRSFTQTLDFEGPIGMPAIRRGQLSYTHEVYPTNYVTLSIEDIEPEVTGPTLTTYSVNQVPAVILKATSSAKRYELELAVIYRHITALDTADETYDQNLDGIGGSFSATVDLFQDDHFKIGYIYGQGITSLYQDAVGLNLDAAPKSVENTDLDLVHSVSFWTSYNRYWGRGMRSVISYSLIRLYSDFVDPSYYSTSSNGVYEIAQYATANLTRTSSSGLTYGLEFLYGKLKITEKSAVEDRDEALNKRFQFTLKYDLNWKKNS